MTEVGGAHHGGTLGPHVVAVEFFSLRDLKPPPAEVAKSEKHHPKPRP